MRGIQNKTNKKKKGEKRDYFETFDIYDTTTHIYSVYIYKVFKSIHGYRHKFLMKNFNVKNENQTAKASN